MENELLKHLMGSDGWDAMDSDLVEKKKLIGNKNRLEEAQKVYFALNTEQGQELIKHLVEKFLLGPTASPGDDLLAVGIREGQKRLVKYLIQQIEIAKKG